MTEIRNEVLDELLVGYERPEDLLGDAGLFTQLKKALLDTTRAFGSDLRGQLAQALEAK